jgi:hypothetical protein
MPWSRKLTAPITLNDGQTFATLRDAVAYMFELPEPHLDKPHWQFAVEAFVEAARASLEHARASRGRGAAQDGAHG